MRIAARALPQLGMPARSLIDASPDPVPAPLVADLWRRFGRRIADVPVDAGTRRRLRRGWRLRWIQLFVATPLLVAVTALALLTSATGLLAERGAWPWAAGVLLILAALANAALALLADRWRQPRAVVLRGGDVLVDGVHPSVAAEWSAANPPGAVTVIGARRVAPAPTARAAARR